MCRNLARARKKIDSCTCTDRYVSELLEEKNMERNFTDEDIKRHLAELGYANVPDQRLRVFVKDLRRLMKYEEKKRRLTAELEEMENRQSRQKTTRYGTHTRNTGTCRPVTVGDEAFFYILVPVFWTKL
jgi:hypothetical protein